MNEVGGYAVRNLIDLALHERLDPSHFFAPSGLDWRDWLKTSRRLDWDVYCDLFERFADHVGGLDRCERLGDRIPEASPTLSRALSTLVTPRQLFGFFARGNRHVWRCVDTRVRDEAEDVILVEAAVDPGYRGCLPLMAGTTGAFRSATRRIDHPPAQVEVLELTGRKSAWRVRLPPPKPRLEQLARTFSSAWVALMEVKPDDAVAILEEIDRERTASDAERSVVVEAMSAMTGALLLLDRRGEVVWASPAGRALVDADAALIARLRRGDAGHGIVVRDVPSLPGHRVAVAHDVAEERLRREARATEAWALTPMQATVLGLVAQGLTNKEIAARLGSAESTVEVHVTALLRKAETGNRSALIARFWTQPLS